MKTEDFQTIEEKMLAEWTTLFEDFKPSKQKGAAYESRLHADKSEPTNPKNRGPRTLVFANAKKAPRVYDRDAPESSYLLIDFYALRKNLTRPQAEEELAQRYGIDPTRHMTERERILYREAQERRAKLSDWLRKAQAAWEDGSATTAKALAYAEGRGWDAEFRQRGGLFIASGLNMPQLLEIVKGTKHSTKAPEIGHGHAIGIPYYSGGKIRGFSFRDITGTAADGRKYLNFALDTDKGLNGTYLFGLTPARRDAEWVVLLEGQADTIRARIAIDGIRDSIMAQAEEKRATAKDLRERGQREEAKARDAEAKALESQAAALPEVAGMGTDGIRAAHAAQLTKMGYTKAIIMTDTEGASGNQGSNNAHRWDAIKTLYAAGLEAYAAEFPQAYDAEGNALKVDADAFLRADDTEEGRKGKAEAFADLLTHQRKPGWAWRRDTYLAPKYDDIDLDENPEARDKYAREVLDLAAAIPPIDRDPLFTQIEDRTGRLIRADSLKAILEAEDTDTNKRKAQEELQKGLAAAQKEEDPYKALQTAQEATAEAAKLLTKAANESKTAAAANLDFWGGWAEAPEGIDTQYFTYASNGEPTRMTLRGGGLSFICASSNHGKTQMLINLAVEALRNGHKIAFVSYEEDKREITKYFANIAASVTLSKNNRRTISSMARAQTPEELLTYVTRTDGTNPQAAVEAFRKGAAEMEQANHERRLLIRDTDERVGELCSWIKYTRAEVGTEVFFVDYIQVLPPDVNAKDNRKADITEVCQALRRTAIESGAAIILAAQLNRNANGIGDAGANTIADASDIQHVADLTIWIRNSRDWDAEFYESDKKTKESNGKSMPRKGECEWYSDRGYHPGRDGGERAIFARIIKSRGNSDAGNTAVLPFDGNTGVISPEPYWRHPHQKAAGWNAESGGAYEGWIAPCYSALSATQERETINAMLDTRQSSAPTRPAPTQFTAYQSDMPF